MKSTEAQAHVAEGLGTLVGRYYTNFSMLGGQRYEENDLARIIMNAAQRQSGTFEGLDVVKDKLDIPSDDVFATVSRGKNLGVVMTVKSVLDTYSASPYGWPYAATLACIGHLYGSDRIMLTLDGKLVQRSEAARVLRETRTPFVWSCPAYSIRRKSLGYVISPWNSSVLPQGTCRQYLRIWPHP